MIETKVAPVRIIEAKADGSKGRAVALVSVFNNVDYGGDRVLPGAFAKTLANLQAKGDPIPVIWSHDWDNPESFVGQADPSQIKETEEGLVVPMEYDLDRPRAEQVFHLLKLRRVTQFSFGYHAKDFAMVEDPDFGPVRELKEIDLFEVGPTLLGMNPDTQLLEAASLRRGRKVGRVLSSKNEELIRTAHDGLASVLSSLDSDGKSMSAKALEEADQAGHPATPRQAALYRALEDVVETFGLFDQSTGPDGSHYVPEAGNPFASEGMKCSSCVFYEGPQACEIVAGDIEPGAICKFWVIPSDLMGSAPADAATDAPVEDLANASSDAPVDEAAAEEVDGKTVAQLTADSPESVSGDRAATIDPEKLMELLTRPRYTEE